MVIDLFSPGGSSRGNGTPVRSKRVSGGRGRSKGRGENGVRGDDDDESVVKRIW